MTHAQIFDLITTTIWAAAAIDLAYAKHKKRDNYKRPFTLAVWNTWLCAGGIQWFASSSVNSMGSTVVLNLLVIQIACSGLDFKFKRPQEEEETASLQK